MMCIVARSYLPRDLRASLTAAAWEEMALTVASRIEHLGAWLQSKRRYDGDLEVIENASMHIRGAKR
jgi:hypothetical protein